MRVIRAHNLSALEGIRHGFFTKEGGVSLKAWNSLNVSFGVEDNPLHVAQNRSLISQELGNPHADFFSPLQVHGIHVIEVLQEDRPHDIQKQQADALFTRQPFIPMGVQTADCLPILISAQNGCAVMAIHAGWRGAVAGITQKALEVFCHTCQLRPHNLIAALGPCIGWDAFEVGEEVIEKAAGSFSLEGLVHPKGENRFTFDLSGYVERILLFYGVTQIERLKECTFSHTETYFSHRRENGKTGRQASVIMRTC